MQPRKSGFRIQGGRPHQQHTHYTVRARQRSGQNMTQNAPSSVCGLCLIFPVRGKLRSGERGGQCECPGAAVTKDPKQGIKRSKFALLQAGGWKSTSRRQQTAGKYLLCLFQPLVALVAPHLWPHPSSLCLCQLWAAPLSVSDKFLSSYKKPGTLHRGPRCSNTTSSLFVAAKALFPRKVTFTCSGWTCILGPPFTLP